MSIVNMSELVTYDVFKELILEYRIFNNNIYCYFTSAFIGGKLVCTSLRSSRQKYIGVGNFYYKLVLY